MAAQSQSFHWHYNELEDKNFQIHGQPLLFAVIIFSFFLLFTLLCFYARWIYLDHERSATSNATAAALSASTLHPAAPLSRSVGLDLATINSLPIFLHRFSSTSPADETQCSICITTFEDQEKVKVLPQCRHAFHPDCVDKWLATQSSCPLCRDSLSESTSPLTQLSHEFSFQQSRISSRLSGSLPTRDVNKTLSVRLCSLRPYGTIN